MDTNHIIEPERHGFWIAATFTLALLALVLGFASVHRTNIVMAGTQGEIVGLNNKIEKLRADLAVARAAAPAPAPAPAAAPSK
ncbi:MAG: hypothetical protein V4582_21130 [Pseudomonadota bacterium]